MNQRQKRLGEILIEMGVIDEEAVNIALMEQKATGAKLGEILVKMGFATETAVSKALAVQYGIEMITMRDISIQKAREVLKLLDDPKRFLERKVIPIKVEDRTVHLALGNPSLDIQIQVEKAVRTKGYDAVFYVIPQSEADILSHVVYQSSDFAEQFDQHLERALAYERDGNPTNLAIPPLVDTLINFAIVSGASDVHIIGEAGVCRVFFRTDGVFKYVKAIPSSILPKITATIKQRSGMDAADRLRTQDGHMIHTMGSRSVNIRVSYLPLVDRAESLVLRILDENRVILDIDKLGFYEDDLKTIKQALRHPHGLILVTGPTGSGKTTTLYSIIMYLSGFRYSILTIEDPVEYRLPFVRQCQVNRYVDVTPEKMLRAFLRHDPDVILVGEVRDKETAEIAVQAAETGHLVLTTLHTNDAPSAVSRLRDLGVSEVFIASAIRFVISQRIARRICPFCKTPIDTPPDALRELIGNEFTLKQVWRGTGCKECDKTGYKGITIVYEIYPFFRVPYEVLKEDFTSSRLAKIGSSYGYVTMKDTIIRKLNDGIISPDEAIRLWF